MTGWSWRPWRGSGGDIRQVPPMYSAIKVGGKL